MSAICGIYYRDGRPAVAESIVPAMNALAPYGHDGSATWRGQNVALGSQALHVTPESVHESMPVDDSISQCCIVADVRLDNRQELCEQLGLDNSKSQMTGDGQLILSAYRKWGVDCLNYLLGDFAFAIWDKRQRRLFSARDPLGVRPFYYQLTAQRFVFASDMNGVRAASATPDDLDLEFLSAFLGDDWNYPHAERTFYAGVLKLPRAHGMIVDADGTRMWSYWEPQSVPEIRLKSDDDYIEQLQSLLSQSVQARLRTAFPAAAHLSGGLDSSSIAVLAARHLRVRGETLQGYSWAPPVSVLPWQTRSGETPERIIPDERRLVEQLSEREDIPIYYSEVTSKDVVSQRLRKAGTVYDAEFVHEYPVRRHARSHGVRTILSGWGGDELITFNGRGYLADLFRKGSWWRLWRESRMRAKIRGQSTAGILMHQAVAPHLPAWFPGNRRPATDTAGRQYDLAGGVFRPDFVEKLAQVQPLPRKARSFPLGIRDYQLGLLSLEHLPRRMEGWASAGGHAGLTYAYPLLDQRIVEFALGLPSEMFFKNGWNRYLFRKSLRGILPDEVSWNKTKKEPALQHDRSRTGSRAWKVLRPFLNELLSQPREYHFLDSRQVRETIQTNIANGSDQYYAFRTGLFIELLVNHELAAEAQQQLAQIQEQSPESDMAA